MNTDPSGPSTEPPPEPPARQSDKSHPASPDSSRFGMWLFIAGLSMLFAASVVAYIVLRVRADVWPPPGTPPIPAGLWFSTLVILISSVTIQLAVSAARRDNSGRLRLLLIVTFTLGLVFVAAQVANWVAYSTPYLEAIEDMPAKGERIASEYPAMNAPDLRLFVFSYYSLTGIHAAHVLGGLIALLFIIAGAFKGRYTAENHYTVANVALYWHFIDVVWIILFTLLVLKP